MPKENPPLWGRGNSVEVPPEMPMKKKEGGAPWGKEGSVPITLGKSRACRESQKGKGGGKNLLDAKGQKGRTPGDLGGKKKLSPLERRDEKRRKRQTLDAYGDRNEQRKKNVAPMV